MNHEWIGDEEGFICIDCGYPCKQLVIGGEEHA